MRSTSRRRWPVHFAPGLQRRRGRHEADNRRLVAGGTITKGAGVGVPYRARLNERTLLNLPEFHGGAYVYVYVEDTSERGPWRNPYCEDTCTCCPQNPEPRLTLEIADCDRRVSLVFDVDTLEGRSNSLHKLDTSDRFAPRVPRGARAGVRALRRAPAATRGARSVSRAAGGGRSAPAPPFSLAGAPQPSACAPTDGAAARLLASSRRARRRAREG